MCVNGWSGDDCSENIDDCAYASCTPGSTCIDRVASFSCLCPEGKAGKTNSTAELEVAEAGVGTLWPSLPCGTSEDHSGMQSGSKGQSSSLDILFQ